MNYFPGWRQESKDNVPPLPWAGEREGAGRCGLKDPRSPPRELAPFTGDVSYVIK